MAVCNLAWLRDWLIAIWLGIPYFPNYVHSRAMLTKYRNVTLLASIELLNPPVGQKGDQRPLGRQIHDFKLSKRCQRYRPLFRRLWTVCIFTSQSCAHRCVECPPWWCLHLRSHWFPLFSLSFVQYVRVDQGDKEPVAGTIWNRFSCQPGLDQYEASGMKKITSN